MSMRWKNLLIGAFLLAFIALLGGFNATKARILVLHTSDQSWLWANHVDEGIKQALDENRRPVSVKWHYLGLNRKLTADDRKSAELQARAAIDRIDPDVLIAVDDESNALVARDYAGRQRPKLVFTAIVQPPERYGYSDARNVSGIREQLPLAAARDALLAIRPGQATRIAALAVNNETGRAQLEQVQAFDWAPYRLTLAETVDNFVDWRAFVGRAAEQADILLVLIYRGLERGDGDHQAVPGTEIVEWVETHSTLLPLGFPENYVGDGGGLGISPAAPDFGQSAMKLALRWLDQPAGSAAPQVTTSTHFRVGVRASRLASRHLQLPPIYVEAAWLGNNYFP
jgi:hypothetical protein